MWPLAAATLRFSLYNVHAVLLVYLCDRCTSLCIPTRGDYIQFAVAGTGRANVCDISSK